MFVGVEEVLNTSNYLAGSCVFVLFTPVAGYCSCSMHALSSSSLYANEYWLKEPSRTHYIVTHTHTQSYAHASNLGHVLMVLWL